MTLLLTATSHPSSTSTASLILLALLAAVAYLAACVIWPFGPCRKCQGLGRFHAPGSPHGGTAGAAKAPVPASAPAAASSTCSAAPQPRPPLTHPARPRRD